MLMIHYPDCPFCTNSNSTLSIVDVEISGVKFKSIFCNGCKKYFGFHKDYDEELKKIKESVDCLESEVSDLKQ